MTHEAVVELCRKWEEAFIRQDFDVLADLYAEDALVESPLVGKMAGREAFAQAHRAIFSAFSDLTHAFEPPLIDGSRVTIVDESTGTQSGGIMGLPPTGRPFRLRLVFLLELRDGLIVRDRRVYDFTGLLVQVGLLKAKPA